MTNKLVMAVMACGFLFGFGTPSNAHESFQDVLKEEYTLKSFSCKTCHPDGDNRKIRTAFADRIFQQLKGKGLSKTFAIAEKKDEEAKTANPDDFDKKTGAVAEFEKLIAKDFKIAFAEVATQTMTIDEIIKAGLFNGARLDTKKLAAAAEGEAAAEKK